MEHLAGVKVISSQTVPETQGRLYVDKSKNGVREDGEPAMDENNPARRADNNKAIVFSTPLLAVWRKLHVEVDAMGAPPEDEQFDADDWDPTGFLVPLPDTSKLDDAFRDAFIAIDILSAAEGSDGNLPFEQSWPTEAARDDYFLGDDDPNDPNDAEGQRKTKDEDPMYWTAYVAGVYELEFPGDPDNEDVRDNDPDTEPLSAALGYTDFTGAEYSMVAMETIRDVAAEHNWSPADVTHVQQLVTVHEIGHQFGLVHPANNAAIFPDHVMTIPETDVVEGRSPEVRIEFADSDIDKIRELGRGDNP